MISSDWVDVAKRGGGAGSSRGPVHPTPGGSGSATEAGVRNVSLDRDSRLLSGTSQKPQEQD